MSPKVVEEKGYQIVIFSDDHLPAHVHVLKGGKSAKFSLTPVALLANYGFSDKMIAEAIAIIRKHKDHCWAIWHKVHGDE